MKRLLSLIGSLLLTTSAIAQPIDVAEANNRVAELINSADYVTLSAELPAVRSVVVKSLLTLADVLVAHSEGRFEDSNRAIGELSNYEAELGAGTVFAMQNFALINHLSSENYAEGKALVEGLLSALPATAEAEESRRGLQSVHRWMSALASRKRVEVERPKRDVVIPVERRAMGRGEHLIVQAKVGDVTEDFIFDTGCSYANMVSRAAAERLGVEIVADSIIVTGFDKGYVQLGVLPQMQIGDVTVRNATFFVAEELVPADAAAEELCEAVLGTHIIRKLGEVRYERSAERFVLPATSSVTAERNLVCDNGAFFLVCHQRGERLLLHFDTGNVKSQLSSRYFSRFQPYVEAEGGQIRQSRSGGFGGVVMHDVRTLGEVQLQIGAERAILRDVAVSLPTEDGGNVLMESGDGSVGVDLLAASDVVTFDLEKMFYRIDK